MKTRKKIIQTSITYTETGYLSDGKDKFITHSFDDEPALIYGNDGTKFWFKNGKKHRDNNLPALIWYNGDVVFYKNGKQYWIINNKKYYSYGEVIKKFKNNILDLPNVENTNILKDNGIDAIWLDDYSYLILDQSQYNLAILKFL